MPTYEFTLVVKLPLGAPEPRVFFDALMAFGCDNATLVAATPEQMTFAFRRDSVFENGAIQSAIDDFTKAARAVHRTAGMRKATYEFELLVGSEKIGGGPYEITDNKL